MWRSTVSQLPDCSDTAMPTGSSMARTASAKSRRVLSPLAYHKVRWAALPFYTHTIRANFPACLFQKRTRFVTVAIFKRNRRSLPRQSLHRAVRRDSVALHNLFSQLLTIDGVVNGPSDRDVGRYIVTDRITVSIFYPQGPSGTRSPVLYAVANPQLQIVLLRCNGH